MTRPIAAAELLCADLDRTLASRPDDETEDRINQVLDLLPSYRPAVPGKCGELAASFAASIEYVEQGVWDDAKPDEVGCGRWGDDPYYVSARLETALDETVEAFCREFLADATAILARVSAPLLAAE